MRFSLRRQPLPQWVDDLAWTPDLPFGGKPRPSNDAAEQAAPTAEVLPPEWKAAPVFEPVLEPAPSPPPPDPPQAAAPLPAPANSNARPSLLGQRLAIGLAQGVGLLLLIQLRAQGLWPGDDPYLFAALAMAGLFAPLVWLEGLGEVPQPLLLISTAAVALMLASLGLYHHWRIQGPDQGHVGLTLALTVATVLVIAQSFLKAGMKGGKAFADYAILSDTAWTLVARLTLWSAITALAWRPAGYFAHCASIAARLCSSNSK